VLPDLWLRKEIVENCHAEVYGIPLWGTASNSKIEILQRFQNKVLRSIVNAPWYVPNTLLHTDLQIPTVKAEITNFSIKYREKLTTHPNELTPALLEEEEEPRRLKRFKPTELTRRFSSAPPTGTRAFALRIFNGIFLYKPCTKSVDRIF
jgi:hypothetical protein